MDDELRERMRGLSLLEKIKLLNEEEKKASKEKERLINQKVEYNEETLKIFEQYVKDFQFLYPGILTDEEIMDRLKANIKTNIIFTPKLADYGIEGVTKGGAFIPDSHVVVVYDKFSEKTNRVVLFHELTHALVCSNPYDNIDHEYYEDDNFITESIVTIMEEDFYKKIYHENHNRVNNYIPNYARGLRAIFGDELIKSYIKRFRNIEDLFSICEGNTDYNMSLIGSDLISDIDGIYYYLKENFGEVNVECQNATVELKLATILDMYLSNTNLSDEEKLKRIEALATTEIRPNFALFRNIIEKHIKDKSLLEEHEIAKFMYLAPTLSSEEISKIKRARNDINERNVPLLRIISKYDDYCTRELFGVNEYTFDEMSGLPSCNVDKYELYLENKDLYKGLYSLVESGMISMEDLSLIDVKKSIKERDTKLGIEEQIKHGEEEGAINLFNTINSDPSIYRCKTKDKEYYLVDVYGSMILLNKMSIPDAISKYAEFAEEDDEYKDGYIDAITRLKALYENGMTEVFMSDSEYIYEKDGEACRNTIVSEAIDEENDIEKSFVSETKWRLENTSVLACKSSSKKR